MHRKSVSAALTALFIVGLVTATYLVAKSPFDQPTVKLLYPKEPADHLFWPRNHTWLWSVNHLDPSTKVDTLSLVARVVHKRLGKGESPVIGPRPISKADAVAEISLGQLQGVDQKESALVGVQLIDLNGAAIPAGKKPLRLLLHLQVGGTTVSHVGEQSVIDGKEVVGSLPNSKATWKEGELHLQNLFVREEDRVAIYDLVLIQSK